MVNAKDEIILQKIKSGEWVVDCDKGKIYRKNDTEFAQVGYCRIFTTYKGKIFNPSVHRIVFIAANNRPIQDGMEIHHIDGNTFNNKISNLKEVTHTENCALRDGRKNYVETTKKHTDSVDDVILQKLQNCEWIVDCENGVVMDKNNKPLTIRRELFIRDRVNGKLMNFLVHRIVFIAYNNRCIKDGCQIDHYDNDVCNNNIHNLFEVTALENVRKKDNIKLKNANDIVAIYEDKRSIYKIAKDYDIHASMVSQIKLGKIYSDITNAHILPDKRDVFNRANSKITSPKIVLEIYNSDEKYSVLAEKYNTTKTTISRIKNGISFSDITHHGKTV